MKEQPVTATRSIQLIANTKNSNKGAETNNNNNTQKKTQINVKVTFCRHVGWDGLLLMLLILVVSGLFMYITYLYTSYFSRFDRGLVWLFIATSASFFLLVIYYILFWRKLVKRNMEEELQTNAKTKATSFLRKAIDFDLPFLH